LPDGNRVKFPPKDTIRLYLTRKYTDAGLGELVTEAGLVRLGNMRSGFDQNPVDPRRPHTTFGTELLLLAPTAASVNSAWQSVFLSYGEPDSAFAEMLRKALVDRGVQAYMYSRDGIPGDKLDNMMYQGVYQHDRTILVCSERSLDRQGVLNELTMVRDREISEGGLRRLLPVTLDQYVFGIWKPQNRYLATMVRSSIIANFIGADRDAAKFRAGVDVLLDALKR